MPKKIYQFTDRQLNNRNIEKIAPDEVFKLYKYNNNYYVSNYGRVYSIKSNKLLKAAANTKGYLFVTLCNKGEKNIITIHRLVFDCFGSYNYYNSVPELHNETWEIHHIDHNNINNKWDNLVYLPKTAHRIANDIKEFYIVTDTKTGKQRKLRANINDIYRQTELHIDYILKELRKHKEKKDLYTSCEFKCFDDTLTVTIGCDWFAINKDGKTHRKNTKKAA